LPDSNRGWRICNPLPYHLAKGPSSLKSAGDFIGFSGPQQESKALQALAQSAYSPPALLVGRGVALRGDLAGLHVVEAHRLRGDELGTRLRGRLGDGERNRRHAVAVAVQQVAGVNHDAADAHRDVDAFDMAVAMSAH